MKTFTQQQTLDAYDKLPSLAKDAIFAEATTEKIQAIGKKHGLLIDKMGALAEDVGYVMLGLIKVNEFAEYVMDSCGVSAQKASEIIADLNRDIFSPIHEHIVTATQEPKPAPKSANDIEASPAFRPSSFAMPMGDSSQKPSSGQPTIAPMIFPQKLREETSMPATNIQQNQPSIAPKAPEFREVAKSTAEPSKLNTPKAIDAYREEIL